jgi:hypothetical protein
MKLHEVLVPVLKQRDPNWRTLQSKRQSGASGQHKDKKKELKYGRTKHKLQNSDSRI